MLRYAVFGYDTYYPSGGWNDWIGSFATLDEARECAEADTSEFHDIIDLETNSEVK